MGVRLKTMRPEQILRGQGKWHQPRDALAMISAPSVTARAGIPKFVKISTRGKLIYDTRASVRLFHAF